MKDCPVCGARAFDDADVCYGCLHRFDEPSKGVASAQGGSRELAPRPAMASALANSLASGLALTGALPNQPGELPGNVPSVPVAMACDEVGASAAQTEGAGWVVRLELPGHPPIVESLRGGSVGGEQAAQAGGQPGNIVVRIQPAGIQEDVRPRSQIARGCHAREGLTVVRGTGKR